MSTKLSRLFFSIPDDLRPRSSDYLLLLEYHNVNWYLPLLQGDIYCWNVSILSLEERLSNHLTTIVGYIVSWERLFVFSDDKLDQFLCNKSKLMKLSEFDLFLGKYNKK